ncbi:hypothetical protein Q9233_002744 [Columba guinea]|nr:hypothetical protein Q9233_002744 [Columba guinea]
MFNLMKKDKEKDGARKEKKEKKEKKERMSAAELKSLEEMSMRRGFFNLNRASKRDSKTRLEISNPIPIKVASGSDLHLTDIDSDSNRGSVILDSGHLSTASSSDDLKVDDANFKGSVLQRAAKFGSLAKQNSQMIVKRFSFSQKSRDESTSETSTPSEHSAAPSPQVEVRTLETQLTKQGAPPGHPHTPPATSPRATVPELVGKKFPAELRLPAVVPPQPPPLRQLELQRRNTGDFGFSLRRTTMLDRAPDGQVYRRVVHFAEPGAGTKDLALGLVPGDRLVEINGRNVENKSRDEIVEMIRQSGETVQLKVQPILELSELSRCWLRGGHGTRRAAWDVKDEDKSLAVKRPGKEDGASESSKDVASAPPNPEPPNPELPKSPELPPGRGKSPEPVLNGAAVNGLEAPATEVQGDDGQGLSRRRVVRVVRKVVRKVLPGEDTGSAKEPGRDTKSPEPVPPPRKEESSRPAIPAPPAPPPPLTVPAAPAKPEPKDEISAGLKTLMAKGKTKEHRPRLRPGDRREEKSPEPAGGDAKPSLSPGAEAKPEPLVQPSGGKTEPAKAPKPTALERHKLDPTASASAPSQAKTEEQIAAEEAWYETEKVWLVHRDGFSLGNQLRLEEGSPLPEGKVKVKLDHDGTVLEVEEDDVEKANPPSCDRVEDLASLLYLNESSVLHTLRQRYGSNLLHTYAGPTMVIINPLSSPSMYSEKVTTLPGGTGGDRHLGAMPPHRGLARGVVDEPSLETSRARLDGALSNLSW